VGVLIKTLIENINTKTMYFKIDVDFNDVWRKCSKREKLDFITNELHEMNIKDFCKVMNEVSECSDIMWHFYEQDKVVHIMVEREDKKFVKHMEDCWRKWNDKHL
jgi:hypothetical protein